MRKVTLIVVLLAAVATGPAFAAGTSKEEGIGVGMGAVLGGAIGGPAGVIVGAAIGAKFGDTYHRKNDEVDQLSTSLASSEKNIVELKRNIDALGKEIRTKDGELKRTAEMARPDVLALLQAGIEMDLLFRTDEHVLTGDTGSRLSTLAGSLASMPDVNIRIDGFADERGDETYNQALSVRRAEHVRDVLVQNGVPASRIQVNAHGESPAAEPGVDNYALERRVSLTLYLGDAQSFAATPR